MEKTKTYLWVIKDSQNNFAHGNSIKINHGILYVSFKTFSPECRGYVHLIGATEALDKLRFMDQSVGLGETFRLEFYSMDELIQEHRTFKGENMVVRAIQIRKNNVIRIPYPLSS